MRGVKKTVHHVCLFLTPWCEYCGERQIRVDFTKEVADGAAEALL